jgi:hypothetical protein
MGKLISVNKVQSIPATMCNTINHEMDLTKFHLNIFTFFCSSNRLLAFLHVPNISFYCYIFFHHTTIRTTMHREWKHIHLYVSIIFPTLCFVFTLCNQLHCALIFFLYRIAGDFSNASSILLFEQFLTVSIKNIYFILFECN